MRSPKSAALLALLAAGLLSQSADAQTSLIVNDASPLAIVAPGMSYAVSGSAINLRVPTNGFLFCANPLPPSQSPQFSAISLTPAHGNWVMPVANDVYTFSYGAGGNLLRINNNPFSGVSASSLVCHTANAQGWPISPFENGLFYDTFEQLLPANPYGANENVVASVTGLQGNGSDGERMLTQIDPNNGVPVYMYMFRLHASTNVKSNVHVMVKDAYDASRLSATAWHCALNQRPTGTINLRQLCNGSAATQISGTIERSYYINNSSDERYIVVHRVLQGSGSLDPNKPLAGAAVFVDPSIPKADRYVGDNVVFSLPPQ